MEAPPTVEYHGAQGRKLREDSVAATLREEANKLDLAIKARTIGGDVCLDPQEARDLANLLRELAAKLNCRS
jgi:hypothetical protein